MTFEEFIKSKNTKDFAKSLGVRHATARMWITRNHISRRVWPVILNVYPEIGLNDLLAMEASSLQNSDEG